MLMNIDQIERTAQYLHNSHRNGERFEGAPEAYRPRNLQEAYAAQDRFLIYFAI